MLGKSFEALIRKKITTFLNAHNLLNLKQFDFRQRKSVANLLLLHSAEWNTQIDSGKVFFSFFFMPWTSLAISTERVMMESKGTRLPSTLSTLAGSTVSSSDSFCGAYVYFRWEAVAKLLAYGPVEPVVPDSIPSGDELGFFGNRRIV